MWLVVFKAGQVLLEIGFSFNLWSNQFAILLTKQVATSWRFSFPANVQPLIWGGLSRWCIPLQGLPIHGISDGMLFGSLEVCIWFNICLIFFKHSEPEELGDQGATLSLTLAKFYGNTMFCKVATGQLLRVVAFTLQGTELCSVPEDA